MNKINLVLHDTDWTSFRSFYLEDIFKKYFNYSYYDATTQYDKKSTLFVAGCNTTEEWIVLLETSGYKVVIDNLWDPPITNSKHRCITNLNWFWYNDCLLYMAQGYQDYMPKKTYTKRALMPLNKYKLERKLLIEQLSDILDDFIYSYDKKRLPCDMSDETNRTHYNNTCWYDDTYFSVVAETLAFDISPYTIVTEKTFKPIAFYHPFILLAQPKTLAYLKLVGFETYSNLFDEEYDNINDNNTRLLKVVEQIKSFVKEPYGKLTKEKLDHNHNLFFDVKQVEQRIINEIIHPLITYVET